MPKFVIKPNSYNYLLNYALENEYPVVFSYNTSDIELGDYNDLQEDSLGYFDLHSDTPDKTIMLKKFTLDTTNNIIACLDQGYYVKDVSDASEASLIIQASYMLQENLGYIKGNLTKYYDFIRQGMQNNNNHFMYNYNHRVNISKFNKELMYGNTTMPYIKLLRSNPNILILMRSQSNVFIVTSDTYFATKLDKYYEDYTGIYSCPVYDSDIEKYTTILDKFV